ncbi:MAG TPA: hypothetical protein DEB17_09065 [Chlorobaculum sp.]|uniref:Uncharacterized protein n=1 Tax=Chlorobaculum tepidum (strain ATCC 49652 / DSM 12025 / NBRC 103806 / TLS) TaxID=194439 RepID=Q8KE21_CHLTE|nr:hypothetical protein CT0871 [Chlorobaculum tepidum TLS]HBU24118.1 hypothetical protein [Chlorobaculum sp.]
MFLFRECNHDNSSREFLQQHMTNIPPFFPVPGQEKRQTKPPK